MIADSKPIGNSLFAIISKEKWTNRGKTQQQNRESQVQAWRFSLVSRHWFATNDHQMHFDRSVGQLMNYGWAPTNSLLLFKHNSIEAMLIKALIRTRFASVWTDVLWFMMHCIRSRPNGVILKNCTRKKDNYCENVHIEKCSTST